jgi:hypothetical protein
LPGRTNSQLFTQSQVKLKEFAGLVRLGLAERQARSGSAQAKAAMSEPDEELLESAALATAASMKQLGCRRQGEKPSRLSRRSCHICLPVRRVM